MAAAGMDPEAPSETSTVGGSPPKIEPSVALPSPHTMHPSQQHGVSQQQATSPMQPLASTNSIPMPPLQSEPAHRRVDLSEITPAPLPDPCSAASGLGFSAQIRSARLPSSRSRSRGLHSAPHAHSILDSALDQDRIKTRAPHRTWPPQSPTRGQEGDSPQGPMPRSRPQKTTPGPTKATRALSPIADEDPQGLCKHEDGRGYGDGADPALPVRQEAASTDCDQESISVASAVSEPCAYWAARRGVPRNDAAVGRIITCGCRGHAACFIRSAAGTHARGGGGII